MTTRTLLVTAAALVLSAGWAQAGDAKAGLKRYLKNCVNCHGKTGKGMASFPPLKDRDAAYVTDRLKKYRAKEKVGPNSAVMMSWAIKLSDEEIANLAAYVSTTFKSKSQ